MKPFITIFAIALVALGSRGNAKLPDEVLLFSGPGEIKGKVIDRETGEPLLFANVYVEVGARIIGTTTDEKGKFTLKPLKPGIYDLKVSYVGKQLYVKENIRVNADKITFADDVLMVSNELPPVNIPGWKKKLIDPDNTGGMVFLPADIKTDPNLKEPMKMIATLAPGIYQPEGGGEQPLYFKGARADASQFIVDGVKTTGGNLGIPSSSIGGITIYTGGVPAKYGDFTGGVVIIETKSYFDLLNENR